MGFKCSNSGNHQSTTSPNVWAPPLGTACLGQWTTRGHACRDVYAAVGAATAVSLIAEPLFALIADDTTRRADESCLHAIEGCDAADSRHATSARRLMRHLPPEFAAFAMTCRRRLLLLLPPADDIRYS